MKPTHSFTRIGLEIIHIHSIFLGRRIVSNLSNAKHFRVNLFQIISNLFSSSKNAYDLSDEWRNDVLHGNEYWHNKVAIILNLIFLLMLDVLGPSI